MKLRGASLPDIRDKQSDCLLRSIESTRWHLREVSISGILSMVWNLTIDPYVVHPIIRHISNVPAATSSTCHIAAGDSARPNLDTSSIARVRHGNVVDIKIFCCQVSACFLHAVEDWITCKINFPEVLAKRAHRDAVRSNTDHILNYDVGTIRLKGDTVVVVINIRVLNDNWVGFVEIPSIYEEVSHVFYAPSIRTYLSSSLRWCHWKARSNSCCRK